MSADVVLGFPTSAARTDVYVHLMREMQRTAADADDARAQRRLLRKRDAEPIQHQKLTARGPLSGLTKNARPTQDGRSNDVPRTRIELVTPGFSDLCSTD